MGFGNSSYVIKPHRFYYEIEIDEEDCVEPLTIIVHEEQEDLTDTGIVDEHGVPIWRRRNPIGFRVDK